MANFAVISIDTGELVNTIVASSDDVPPEGCRLVEIPNGYYWDGAAVSLIPSEEVYGD